MLTGKSVYTYFIFCPIVACGGAAPAPVAPPIGRGDLLGDAGLRQAVLMGPQGGREVVPSQIPATVVVDEAKPVSMEPQVCFDVTVRTESTYDMELSAMNPRCVIDGMDGEASLDEVRPPQREVYPYDVYHMGDLQPTPHRFEVVTRAALICCGRPVVRLLELRLHNDLMADDPERQKRFEQRFNWEISARGSAP